MLESTEMTTIRLRRSILWLFFLSAISVRVSHGQPYEYVCQYESLGKGSSVFRLNLQTGLKELLLPDEGRLGAVFVSSDGQLLFLTRRSEVEVVNALNPSLPRKSIALDLYNSNRDVNELIDGRLSNRIYLAIGESIDMRDMWLVLDRSSIIPIDTIFNFQGPGSCFLSRDESVIYGLQADTLASRVEFVGLSTHGRTEVSREDFSKMGYPSDSKSYLGGANGKAVIAYDDPVFVPRWTNQRYFVYDVASKVATKPIPVTFRSEAQVSLDGNYLIVEKVNFDKTRRTAEYRPGLVLVFHLATGQLKQRLQLPPEGRVMQYPDFPNMFFYYSEEQARSVVLKLSEVTAAQTLLDTLISQIKAAGTAGWLSDQSFIIEIERDLQRARQMLSAGDSLGCAKGVKSFQGKIDFAYKGSLGPDEHKVTIDGWKSLHYDAQYILDRLPAIPPGSDSR